jgi:metal-responsive CopG/Arc/MetJ family transcriptional regulator
MYSTAISIATSLAPDEVQELDQLRREQGISRAEAVRDAVRWYVRWAERLPFEDPAADEIEP